MKQSNIKSIKRLIISMIVIPLLALNASAQSIKPWCEDLYVGDIRVPTKRHLSSFRNILRTNIAAILSDIGGCSFIERNSSLESLIEQEGNVFSPGTLSKIINYTDEFLHEIKWGVLGELTETNKSNEYSLEVRMIRVASRISTRRFTYVFKVDEDFDQRDFDRDFRLKFLEEIDQVLTVTGGITGQLTISEKNFVILPTRVANSFKFDEKTGRFSFKVPKHELEHQPLSIEISGATVSGKLESVPKGVNDSIKSNTVDVGRIRVSQNQGQLIDLKWQNGTISCNDFEVTGVTLYSSETFVKRTSVTIIPGKERFSLELPSDLPADTKVSIHFGSNNYSGLKNPVSFYLREGPQPLKPIGYHAKTGLKLIPGWQEAKTGFWPLGALILGAQVYTIDRYLYRKGIASNFRHQARQSTSFVTREKLSILAEEESDEADNFLIFAAATYGFHLFYSFVLRPCQFYNKKGSPFSLMPDYQSGTIGISLSYSIL